MSGLQSIEDFPKLGRERRTEVVARLAELERELGRVQEQPP